MAYEYIDSTGLIVPNTADLLVEAQDEYKVAFGNDLVVTPDTPQGVMIAAETLARTEMVNNNAAVANQINPNVAGGVFLDAIMALSGIQRVPATQTLVVAVILTGVTSTIIPAGTQAKTAAGDIFASLSTVTITAGTATVNFASVEYGPIPCAAFALDQIVTNILGWETVSNPTQGVLGAATQSDIAARALRSNTLAFQGVALPISAISALYNVAGVQSLRYLENVTGATDVIEGITLVANSIYACVNGGSDLDVAAALLENKSSGCGWNGTTSVDIVEPASGQTYTVLFDRPSEIEIAIQVTSPNGALSDIQAAILNYISGGVNGLQPWVVGGSISPFEIAGAIVAQYPAIQVNIVKIKIVGVGSYDTAIIPIAVNEIAFSVASDITLVVG